MNKFTNWLNDQLRERKLKAADLARDSGLAPSTISRILNGETTPSDEAYTKIARALGEPPEKVLRIAGRLPAYFVDEQGRRFDFDVLNSKGILGAAHQFTTGHYYDDINPGLVLGISLPVDTPLELGPVWLKAEEDPGFSIYLGKASEIPLVDG